MYIVYIVYEAWNVRIRLPMPPFEEEEEAEEEAEDPPSRSFPQ